MKRVLFLSIVALSVILSNVVTSNVASAVEPHIFIMFFDWGSADLPPPVRPMVKAAAKAWLANQAKPATSHRILIVGHCDTSEKSPTSLSLDRAKAIQAELIKFGVPASADFVIQGAGARDLLVPTEAGVQQAQNRRGYIDITF